MHELIYDSKAIHTDETPVKVMQIDKTKIQNGKKTYMLVYRSSPHCSKNFVQIESSNSANASAMVSNLAETAKANGVNTYQYFELLLT